MLISTVSIIAVTVTAMVTNHADQFSSTYSTTYMIWATILGALSAVSLPLGSAIGLVFKPKPSITATAAAFGAGALLAALSIELVAPTLINALEHHVQLPDSDNWIIEPIALIIGSALGGILFVVLDQLVNRQGGYLRKTATTISYLSSRREKRMKVLLNLVTNSKFLTALKPDDIGVLLDFLKPVAFTKGEILFKEGDPADKVYFIENGNIDLIRNGEKFITVGGGEIIGELAVIIRSPRHIMAIASSVVKAWMLTKTEFEHVCLHSPELQSAAIKLASERLEDLGKREFSMSQDKMQWTSSAAQAIREGSREIPTPQEFRDAAKQHSGAPLAIWLGIFLDGIPESFVIGATFLAVLTSKMAAGNPEFTDVIPYTLIAGLFLSNFPEAMSSSVGMKHQGWSAMRILTLWISLMVMTGIGAAVGYTIGADVPEAVTIFIEGVAAGAMLTMIAQTMIPEAVHLGGSNIVGLSTLAGFLSAIAFKLLE